MVLSPHFTLEELTHTNFTKHSEENRILSPAQVQKLRTVCTTLLEPVRAQFGPVLVHSGYRCAALNSAIGGSATSQHMLCEAVDFSVPGRELEDVFQWIKSSSIPVGQCIEEGHNSNGPTWIHISLGAPYRAKSKCREFLTFNGRLYKKA